MSARHKPLPLELWSERDLSAAVVELARLGGWKRYHTFDAKRSNKGFPDWVFVKGARLIFAELKSESGKLRPEQEEWLWALEGVNAELGAQDRIGVYLWRPSDLEEIASILTGRKAA